MSKLVRNVEYPRTREQIEANVWLETTREHYWEMLEILPPERQEGGAFAVGEELSHLTDGQAVFDCFMVVDGRYFAKPNTLPNFDPVAFEEEIRQQHNVW